MFLIKLKLFLRYFFLLSGFLFFPDYISAANTDRQNILNLKPICDGKIYFSPNEFNKPTSFPKKIDIRFANSNAWYQNLFGLIKFLENPEYKHTIKIPKKFKNYHPAKIIVEYSNKKICVFDGEGRVHGGRGDHVSNENFLTSLRMRIKNGNINGINNFILFLPESRNGNSEIFTTLMLKKFKILSPFTMNINVSVNDKETGNFIFQEKIDENFLFKNKKTEGLILAANKSYQINDNDIEFNDSFDRLSFISNDTTDQDFDFENAVNNLNYYLIQNYIANKNKDYSKKIYKNMEVISSVDFAVKNFNRIKYENFRRFEALMLAMGAHHALALHDIKYYFDKLHNKLEPIYYDGDSKILENFRLSKDQTFNNKVFDSHRIGAESLIKELRKINLLTLRNDLEKRNVNLANDEILKFINLLEKNLETIIKAEILDSDKVNLNILNFNFFENEKQKNKRVFLAFGGKNKIINLCNVKLVNCEERLINKKEYNNIFTRQISSISDKKIFYLASTLKSYKNREIPLAHGIETFKNINLDENTRIFFKYPSTKIDIDKSDKKINFNVIESKERIIIISKNFNDWVINYSNITPMKNKFTKSLIKDSFPSGCVNFIDSKISNLEIKIDTADCPDALHFNRTKGNVAKIEIEKSSYDSLDADFSDLSIENIKIDLARQECIGLKSGKYILNSIILKNCGDKGLSAGELAETNVANAVIENSKIAVVSKDTSEVFINKLIIKNISSLCLGAYKAKNNFSGSSITISKPLNNCDEKRIVSQKGSFINLNNEL